MNNVHDAFYKTLKEYHVRSIFHLPGSVSVPLYEDFESLNSVLMKSPAAAGCAADALGRLTGIGVAMIAQGPGIAGSIPSIIQSWKDHVPVVIFTGKPCYMEGDPHAWQAFPMRAVLEPLTKAIIDVDESGEPLADIDLAFKLATTPPCGPVVINVCETPPKKKHTIPKLAQLPKASDKFLQRLSQALNGAERPLVIAGGGSLSGSARLNAFIHKFNIPITTTTIGRGVVDENDTLSLGPVGTIGMGPANKALQEADVILALGARLSKNVIQPLLGCKSRPRIFQVAGSDLDRSPLVEMADFTTATVKSVLEFLEGAIKRAAKAWIAGPSAHTPAQNKALADILAQVDRDTTVVIDAGTMSLATHKAFVAQRPNHLLFQWGIGTMGSSLATSIGAAFSGTKRIFVITGDGGFMAGMSELTTIAEKRLPIKIALFNNHGLEFIRNIQRQELGKDTSLNFGDIDLVSLAKSLKIDSFKVNSGEGLSSKMIEGLTNDKPLFLDIEMPAAHLDLKGTQWDKK